jgi:N utilization substance protein A
METLDIDEMMSQLLVSEGFTNLEEVAYVETDELLSIDGFDEGTAGELQARARDYLEAANNKALENAKVFGVQDELIAFEGLTPQMLEALGKEGIKSLEDFATCADWELSGGWTTVNGQRVKDSDAGVLGPAIDRLQAEVKFETTAEEFPRLVADLEAHPVIDGVTSLRIQKNEQSRKLVIQATIETWVVSSGGRGGR